MAFEDTDTNNSQDLGLLPVGQTLPIVLVRAREALLSHWRGALTEAGFTEQQWRVLRVTAELGPLDISKLSQETALHMPSVTRILHALEERGYVSRQRDEDDSRRSWIEITDKAREKMAEVAKHSDRIYAAVRKDFDDDKMRQLIDLLNDFAGIQRFD